MAALLLYEDGRLSNGCASLRRLPCDRHLSAVEVPVVVLRVWLHNRNRYFYALASHAAVCLENHVVRVGQDSLLVGVHGELVALNHGPPSADCTIAKLHLKVVV